MPDVEEVVEDVLQHYGVKGMHWGSRKSGSTGGSKSERPAPSREHEHLQRVHSVASTHKSTSSLSNKELQDAITRMNLTQQYSKLSGGKDKTRTQKGHQFISELISGAGKQQTSQALNKGINAQVGSMMKNLKVV